MICDGCGEWIVPRVDHALGTAACPLCSHRNLRRFLPLFVVIGASGVGKTAVVPELRRLLPAWDIFETDILWDSGQDWQFIKCNWLRIAHSLHQSARAVLLCGSIMPDQLAQCGTPTLFPRIHSLALTCDADVQTPRLQARPAFRGSTREFIRAQQEFRQWFLEHAATDFNPSLVLVDTTRTSLEHTAKEIRDWAVDRWPLASSSDRSSDK